MPKSLLALAGSLVLAASLTSCGGDDPNAEKVVVYCALDQIFSEPLLKRFEEETGIEVEARFDVEASKTVGLVNAIRAEDTHTLCDVFWNNEVAHTVALAEEGRLLAYDSPSAAEIPELFRDPERRWTGFAARARILIVNTEKMDASKLTSMWDLTQPEHRGVACMARPLTGTTLTHVVALHERLGPEESKRYLDGVVNNDTNLSSGNATNMKLVRSGELAFGWTDTDDFNVAREGGFPVVAVYPDQAPGPNGEEPLGTMLIPNTLSILAKAPHAENAKRLVDWLLRPEIEAELAQARSAQIPVRPGVERPDHVKSPGVDFKAMDVDYGAIGRAMPERHEALRERFLE